MVRAEPEPAVEEDIDGSDWTSPTRNTPKRVESANQMRGFLAFGGLKILRALSSNAWPVNRLNWEQEARRSNYK
jgi:hypothetical protein